MHSYHNSCISVLFYPCIIYSQERIVAYMKPFYEAINPDISFQVEKVYNLNFPPHWHNEIELFYVCSGHIKLGIEDRSYELHSGDLLIINSGAIHYYDKTDNDSVAIIIIFDPSRILSINKWPKDLWLISDISTREQLNNLSPSLAKRLPDLISEIEHEYATSDSYANLIIMGKLTELSGLLLRHFYIKKGDSSSSRRKNSSEDIKQALLYIQENFTEPLTLEAVASYVGFSRYYFSRIFRQYVGMPFKEYLNFIRISHAQLLLDAREDTIADICYKCGFNSIRTFNRVYQNFHHKPPSKDRHSATP